MVYIHADVNFADVSPCCGYDRCCGCDRFCCCCGCCSGCCCGGFLSAIVLFINDADEAPITTRMTRARMYLIFFAIFLLPSAGIDIFYYICGNEVTILHLGYAYFWVTTQKLFCIGFGIHFVCDREEYWPWIGFVNSSDDFC